MNTKQTPVRALPRGTRFSFTLPVAEAHRALATTSYGRVIPSEDMLWAQQYVLARLERET